MTRRRIAFIIHSLGPGGAERVVSELANNLSNEYDTTIITLVGGTPFYKLNPNIRLIHCSKEMKRSSNMFQSTYNGFGRVATIIKNLKKYNIELAISFMTTANIYAIWASKITSIPCIISERANHEINILPKSLQKIRNFSYKFCNYLVVQTEGNKKFYHNILPNKKILVIQNPVGESLRTLRNLSNDSKKKNTILNVGSFKPGKGQELLIKAFSSIPHDDWQIIFAGEGPCKNTNLALVQNLNLVDKIQFVGNKTNIDEYYNSATIFVFTSEHEGFPNALLEALYFGVPCISTNCPYGPSDLITDGENGFLIPVGNQKMLEKRLIELMSNVDLRNQFTKKALSSTVKFEMELIANNWKKYINQLL